MMPRDPKRFADFQRDMARPVEARKGLNTFNPTPETVVRATVGRERPPLRKRPAVLKQSDMVKRSDPRPLADQAVVRRPNAGGIADDRADVCNPAFVRKSRERWIQRSYPRKTEQLKEALAMVKWLSNNT